MGFHAPQEATRILGESIDFSRKGQNALRQTPKPVTTAAN
jgi:nitrite reductase (cytochrome c-552)